ncbi:MAG: phosphoribosylaminoimidazolesuccinocarboxamide synthase [Bdellovibrionota bacterium]
MGAELPVLYRGSVKDLLGPVATGEGNALVFNYTDAFSVFDWGRMPDLLKGKGEALAVLAAELFERLEKPETWKEFSCSPGALALRKHNRFGAVFNEIGEELQSEGLRTHYLGVLPEGATDPVRLSKLSRPTRQFAVSAVSVTRPKSSSVLGRAVPDYFETRLSPPPRLVPLEVVFRFSLPPGSSLIERVAEDPAYLSSIGFGEWKAKEGAKFEFPILELFTKLEASDRPLALTEALAISGLTGEQLQRLLLKTAWVSGWLRAICAASGLELADGKLEWGVAADGTLFLVDAIGPDELRILQEGVQLSKEFLRGYYRSTPWYGSIIQAKELARAQGTADWKKGVPFGPPALPTGLREAAIQMYLALTNTLTGKRWFSDAPELAQVLRAIRAETF